MKNTGMKNTMMKKCMTTNMKRGINENENKNEQ